MLDDGKLAIVDAGGLEVIAKLLENKEPENVEMITSLFANLVAGINFHISIDI